TPLQHAEVRVDDRSAALQGRDDGGPRAAQRRALRRLHPPGGRAGIDVRVLAAGAADPLPERDAEEGRRGDEGGAGEGAGRDGAGGDGGDGGDAVARASDGSLDL